MCEAEVVAVEDCYAPAPLGVWRVTVRFHNQGEATFVQAAAQAPKVGEVWRLVEPRLAELIRPAPGSSKPE
jgi:hypothetical protein